MTLEKIDHSIKVVFCGLLCKPLWGNGKCQPLFQKGRVYVCAPSCPTLSTPWTIAHQAPLSLEFSRQAYWSGLSFPTSGHLPNPGIEPVSPALAGGFFTTSTTWEAPEGSQMATFISSCLITMQLIRIFLSKYCHFLLNISPETKLVQLELLPLNEDFMLWLLLAGRCQYWG